MTEPAPSERIAEASTSAAIPWGIAFRYDPPRNAATTPAQQAEQAANNWGAIAWALPGWEIREVPGKPQSYLALPPAALVETTPGQQELEREIVKRFNTLTRVRGTSNESLQTELSEEVVRRFLPKPADDDPPNDTIVRELHRRVQGDQIVSIALNRWQPGASRLTVLDRLLGAQCSTDINDVQATSTVRLSENLRSTLCTLQSKELRKLREVHVGELMPGISLVRPATTAASGTAISEPQQPISRDLRVYSFDPSLGTMMETAPIHSVKIPVRWEDDLKPGPIGEYLEVVDIDPGSQCVYAPVDLNHPYVLAQDGLQPSEGNPQFHQQMVYAVAMNTIHRFELALGRPVFWSHLRPWLTDRPEEQLYFTPEARELQNRSRDPELSAAPNRRRNWDISRQMRYVQRLRIYPHARRDDNAYYNPASRALLFGYFPSTDQTRRDYPGGMVFTCLSHDIVAHETTHALVDGMHPYFSERSNPDVLAFHEAFADIMALFQHFTYPDVLRHQIANSGGSLETNNLLGQLAQQFGRARGAREALRSYLGKEIDGKWVRTKPDPFMLDSLEKPHDRGSILVSAVFDAFLDLYDTRVRDLLRIATGGSGVLPAGQIHPDLTNRLATEAAAAAEQVLRICIRAMDYLPPVDVTFGEFLRALITADYDLSPVGRNNRIAFIDAFRSWGIYPEGVTTLSEESLRWRPPEPDSPLCDRLRRIGAHERDRRLIAVDLVAALDRWQPGSSRDEVFRITLEAQAELHYLLTRTQNSEREEVLPGLDWRKGASFSIGNLRPARRIGPQGEFRTELVVEVVQRYRPKADQPDGHIPRRGGATVIIDLRTLEIRYIIYKRLYKGREWPAKPGEPGGTLASRLTRQAPVDQVDEQALWLDERGADFALRLDDTYGGTTRRRQAMRENPFAFVHRGF